MLNPFPTGLFYTNEATGGGGLFVTPYVFFERLPLNGIFLLNHWGPRVYIGVPFSIKRPKFNILQRGVTKRSPPSGNRVNETARTKPGPLSWQTSTLTTELQ